MSLASALFWFGYTLIAVWLQAFFPGPDLFAPALLILLQERSLSRLGWLLEDADGNVLSAKSFHCVTGPEVVTLASGHTVARIAPGESFESGPVELSVPTKLR